PVVINGSILGNESTVATILARGQAAPTATLDVAMASLSVGGKVQFASILGGVDSAGAGFNGNAQICKVTVGGDWIASNLESGCTTTDGNFGDANDAAIPGGTIARIARIAIIGQVIGQVGTNNSFGFFSHEIGSFSVGGVAIPLRSGKYNDTFAG